MFSRLSGAQLQTDTFTNGNILVNADLIEVSLVFSGNPAWYDTYAEAID